MAVDYKIRQIFYSIPCDSGRKLLFDWYVVELPEERTTPFELQFLRNEWVTNHVNWAKEHLGYDIWQLYLGDLAPFGNTISHQLSHKLPTRYSLQLPAQKNKLHSWY